LPAAMESNEYPTNAALSAVSSVLLGITRETATAGSPVITSRTSPPFVAGVRLNASWVEDDNAGTRTLLTSWFFTVIEGAGDGPTWPYDATTVIIANIIKWRITGS